MGTIVITRRIVVIYRSRGVCGEADVGNQKLLAPVVAVSGAFATATEIPMLAVKNAGIRHKKALHSQLQLKHDACGKQKTIESRKKRTPQFFFARPSLIKLKNMGAVEVFLVII